MRQELLHLLTPPAHHLDYLESNIVDNRFLKISSKGYETDLWHATQSRAGQSAIWWLIVD
jgi:hypothetical protein